MQMLSEQLFKFEKIQINIKLLHGYVHQYDKFLL